MDKRIVMILQRGIHSVSVGIKKQSPFRLPALDFGCTSVSKTLSAPELWTCTPTYPLLLPLCLSILPSFWINRKKLQDSTQTCYQTLKTWLRTHHSEARHLTRTRAQGLQTRPRLELKDLCTSLIVIVFVFDARLAQRSLLHHGVVERGSIARTVF